jgi:amidase
VGFGGAIDLVSDPAKVTSANSSALSDYERYDGIGLSELVKAREVSAGDLLEAAVARAEQHNPTINRMYDQAKAAIAAGLHSGPFTGVPYLLKDIGSLYGSV